MHKYYVFFSETRFTIVKANALTFSDKMHSLYRHEPGAVNPWHVRKVTKSGKLGRLVILT